MRKEFWWQHNETGWKYFTAHSVQRETVKNTKLTTEHDIFDFMLAKPF